jgi:hypothetical protein
MSERDSPGVWSSAMRCHLELRGDAERHFWSSSPRTQDCTQRQVSEAEWPRSHLVLRQQAVSSLFGCGPDHPAVQTSCLLRTRVFVPDASSANDGLHGR